jgi:dTDP-glucose pyrophosphorylase
MKVVILAAGKGTRLLPLTTKCPKVLVPICGQPFLYYLLMTLICDLQVPLHDILIIGGYKIEKLWHYIINELKMPEITIVEQLEQKGTAQALLLARDFCLFDKQVLVINGDAYFTKEDLSAMMKSDPDYSFIGCTRVNNPECYGVLVPKDNDKELLDHIVEKPEYLLGHSGLVSVGLYKFNSMIWSALSKVPLSVRGEYELPDAINHLAEINHAKLMPISGCWIDLGKFSDVPVVEQHIAQLLNRSYQEEKDLIVQEKTD